MKRALLIAGGTVGGLGAVLAVTPPQLSANNATMGSVNTDTVPTDNTATDNTSTNTTVDTTANVTTTSEKSTPSAKATASAKATTSKNTSTSTSTNQQATATPTAKATAAATKSASTSGKAQNGTFTGDASTMRYGTVQVKITISNGKITDAVAVQAPSGRDQRWTDMSVPVLRQNTLAAQSSDISGVSGASYTSYAWWVSLQSALKKAGWM
jgi:uncharacterized protein with FMN-binding domain